MTHRRLSLIDDSIESSPSIAVRWLNWVTTVYRRPLVDKMIFFRICFFCRTSTHRDETFLFLPKFHIYNGSDFPFRDLKNANIRQKTDKRANKKSLFRIFFLLHIFQPPYAGLLLRMPLHYFVICDIYILQLSNQLFTAYLTSNFPIFVNNWLDLYKTNW